MKNLLKGALLVGAGAAIGYFVGKKINEKKTEEVKEDTKVEVQEPQEQISALKNNCIINAITIIGLGVICLSLNERVSKNCKRTLKLADILENLKDTVNQNTEANNHNIKHFQDFVIAVAENFEEIEQRLISVEGK